MKLLTVIFCISFVIIFPYIIQEFTNPTKDMVLEQVAPVFELANNYHGIHTEAIYYDLKRRRWIFIRNGNQCILFSENFWNWYIQNWNRRK